MSTTPESTPSVYGPPRSIPASFGILELDGQQYVAPKYLMPALQLEIEKATEIEDSKAINPGVSCNSNYIYYPLTAFSPGNLPIRPVWRSVEVRRRC